MNSRSTLWPPLVALRQQFPPSKTLDLDRVVQEALGSVVRPLKPGARVAVAVGSRGIANLQTIVRAAVRALDAAGARPFILPAMGSHGGGTSEGQAALLADYGITESAVGVPIRPTMEVQTVGRVIPGFDLCVSREAMSADGVLLINRIKPHTDFAGSIGSGLLKMLVVGLGKRAGAAQFHAAACRLGYERVLRAHSGALLETVRVLGGLAILEDQRHQTARIDAIRPSDIEAGEPLLCEEARAMMPRLPFDDIDLLIVDRMGKNLSGTGMDPLVIGRSIHGYSLAEETPRTSPRIRRLFVRDLTPESHGNATGIGLADFTTTRLVQAMDRGLTTVNSLTALSLQGAKIPLHFQTDREVLEKAVATLGLADIQDARIVRILDTLHLEHLQASIPLAREIEGRPGIDTAGDPHPFGFDAAGNLTP